MVYLSEFQFRHDYGKLEDGERTAKAIRLANNKRLTYKALIANG